VARVLFRWLLRYAVVAATGADAPIDVQATSHGAEWQLIIRLPRIAAPHDASEHALEHPEGTPDAPSLDFGQEQASGLDQARGLIEHLGGHLVVCQEAEKTTQIVVTVPLPRPPLVPSPLRSEG